MVNKLNIYFNLIIFLIFNLLFFNFSLSKNKKINISCPNREIIFLLNNSLEESLEKTLNFEANYSSYAVNNPTGISAMSITSIIALEQQAAPLFVSNSLIKNIDDHKNLFKDFITLNTKELYNKYSKYKRFKKYSCITQFQRSCKYVNSRFLKFNTELNQFFKKNSLKNNSKNINNFLNNISQNKFFNEQFAPTGLSDVNQTLEDTQRYKELMIFYLCFNTKLSSDNWIIKKVSKHASLLIPKAYLKEINICGDFRHLNSCKKSSNLTELEKSLGLKVNHLKDLKIDQIISQVKNLANKKIDSKKIDNKSKKHNLTRPSITKRLEKIFVDNKINSKNIWSVYVAGHGFGKCPQLNYLPQLEKLENLYKSQNNIEKLSKIKSEIKKIQTEVKSFTEFHKGIIASLPKLEFQNLLKFCNSSINTTFLYYTSCYSGGDFLVEPYKENGVPLTFNYTIISGTVAENSAIQEMPFLKIAPYGFINYKNKMVSRIDSNDIDFNNKSLKLNTSLQFKSFFQALRDGLHKETKNFPGIVFKLHPYTNKSGELLSFCIANIPLVRNAYANKFKVISNDKSFTKLSSKIKDNKIINLNKQANLICSDYIPQKIVLNKKAQNFDPCFISMLPGLAAHTFEDIVAPKCNLKEVVNSFFAFPELSASKIFWIKNLKCANSGQTYMLKSDYNYNSGLELKDVIIMRNIFNPAQTNNSIFLKNKTNNLYKIAVNGPQLNNNFSITNCPTDNHKNVCLAFCPKIKKYLNKIPFISNSFIA